MVKLLPIISALLWAGALHCNGDDHGDPDESIGDKSLFSPPHHPTVVRLGVELLRIFSVEPPSVESPKLHARFRLHAQWIDERLAGPRASRSFQSEHAEEQLEKMFNPRIGIVTGETELVNSHLYISPNGIVNLVSVVNVTIEANMNLAHFPFDNQLFKFRFASSYWDEDLLDISINPQASGLKLTSSTTSWNFDFSSYYVSQNAIAGHTENFSVFNFVVHAQRDPQSFLWRLLIPLIVIVLLSWNVFWMFEDSSAAFSNCIVFLLTAVAFHQIANTMLPTIPAFTFVDAIVFISYGFIIIPTFEVMITTKLETLGRRETAEHIRRACRIGVPILFALIMLATTLIYFSRR